MSEDQKIYEATKAWADAFSSLEPDALDRLLALADPQIRFKDPFNDVVGPDKLTAIFRDMYGTCVDPRFEIVEVAGGFRAGYIRWIFRFRPKALKRGPEWRVDGVSEIQVGADGKITAHIDHWDSGAQLLARLPLIGALVRLVLRRLRVD
jgi:steroid delta-isomerase